MEASAELRRCRDGMLSLKQGVLRKLQLDGF